MADIEENEDEHAFDDIDDHHKPANDSAVSPAVGSATVEGDEGVLDAANDLQAESEMALPGEDALIDAGYIEQGDDTNDTPDEESLLQLADEVASPRDPDITDIRTPPEHALEHPDLSQTPAAVRSQAHDDDIYVDVDAGDEQPSSATRAGKLAVPEFDFPASKNDEVYPVIIKYLGRDYYLFKTDNSPSKPDGDPDGIGGEPHLGYIIADWSRRSQSIYDILQFCRSRFGIQEDDEVLKLSFDVLGLHIAEGYGDAHTVACNNIINVWKSLTYNDGYPGNEPLYGELTVETGFAARLVKLWNSAGTGLGLSELEYLGGSAYEGGDGYEEEGDDENYHRQKPGELSQHEQGTVGGDGTEYDTTEGDGLEGYENEEAGYDEMYEEGKGEDLDDLYEENLWPDATETEITGDIELQRGSLKTEHNNVEHDQHSHNDENDENGDNLDFEVHAEVETHPPNDQQVQTPFDESHNGAYEEPDDAQHEQPYENQFEHPYQDQAEQQYDNTFSQPDEAHHEQLDENYYEEPYQDQTGEHYNGPYDEQTEEQPEDPAEDLLEEQLNTQFDDQIEAQLDNPAEHPLEETLAKQLAEPSEEHFEQQLQDSLEAPLHDSLTAPAVQPPPTATPTKRPLPADEDEITWTDDEEHVDKKQRL